MKRYKVLFSSLDGTLIETISGNTFPKGIWDMRFKFEVLDAIKKFVSETPIEFMYIVTNQEGIEKRLVDREDLMNKVNYICSAIKEYCNIPIVNFTYCDTNDPEDEWRKPNTKMLSTMLELCNEDKEKCLMIGDASGLKGQYSDTDKKAAENFGIDYMDVNDFVKQ
jgi:DNA 3'-phosphatase